MPYIYLVEGISRLMLQAVWLVVQIMQQTPICARGFFVFFFFFFFFCSFFNEADKNRAILSVGLPLSMALRTNPSPFCPLIRGLKFVWSGVLSVILA